MLMRIHTFRLVVGDGHVQCRVSAAVLPPDTASVAEQHVRDGNMAGDLRTVQRKLAADVDSVRTGVSLQQQQHHRAVPVLGRQVERRAHARVSTVNGRSLDDEDLGDVGVPEARRQMERRLTGTTAGVHACAVGGEVAD